MMPRQTTEIFKNSRIVVSRTPKLDGANNMKFDKEDSQRSNLNIKYLSITLVLKYPDSFICLYCV